MNKNSQILGQIIVYILAVIIFILILGYGYKAIDQFLEKSKTVAFLEFKTELETEIESIRRDYLSIKTVTLNIPPELNTLCLVDSEQSGNLQGTYPLLYQLWLSGSENVFLLPITKQEGAIKLKNIIVFDAQNNQGFTCFENLHGTVTFRLEGLGDNVKITPKQS